MSVEKAGPPASAVRSRGPRCGSHVLRERDVSVSTQEQEPPGEWSRYPPRTTASIPRMRHTQRSSSTQSP
jgi:hypothetical protein